MLPGERRVSTEDSRMTAMQAVIGNNGRVTLPKPIRDELHLRPGDKIDFVVEGDGLRVTIVPASVTQLKGMVPKPSDPVGLQEMDAAILRAAAGRSLIR